MAARTLLAAAEIRAEQPDVGVIVLSQYVETAHSMKLITDGATGVGYLLKDRISALAEFVDAVCRVGAGGSVIDPEVVAQLLGRRAGPQPPRRADAAEREVLALIAEGQSNQAICRAGTRCWQRPPPAPTSSPTSTRRRARAYA